MTVPGLFHSAICTGDIRPCEKLVMQENRKREKKIFFIIVSLLVTLKVVYPA